MRFLANENFPLVSVHELRKTGYEISAIIEEAPGISDEEVLRLAHLEKQIILTFDRDYGKLIYLLKLPAPAGIVYFRFVPASPYEPSLYMSRLLAQEIHLIGRFTVASRDQIRQRPLP